MPPFVGAVAMQLIFGRSGSVNLLLERRLRLHAADHGRAGRRRSSSRAIHYFPFILLNLVVALRNIDGAMEESALNLGAAGLRLFRRIVFPLAMPGFVAGASLVFVKVFDDLGTPLVLGQTNMLAPQAYLRITSVGIEDPLGYVISVIMIVVLDRRAVAVGARRCKGRDYATLQKGGARAAAAPPRAAGSRSPPTAGSASCCCSCSRRTSASCCCRSRRSGASRVLPDAYTLAHYATVFEDSQQHDRQHAALLRPGGRGSTWCSAPPSPTSSCARACRRGRWLDGIATAALADARRRARDRLPAHSSRA